MEIMIRALNIDEHRGKSPGSEDERRMIRAVYAASNQRSARLLGLDLATYGYAT